MKASGSGLERGLNRFALRFNCSLSETKYQNAMSSG